MPSRTYAATIKSLRLNLKRQRSSLGLSQEEAAERLGIATRHYQKIEAGELNVTLSTLCKLADALRTEPSAIIGKLHRDKS